MTEDKELRIPQHVAIILDGNGRWAKAKGMPRSYGHIKGCDNLEKISDVAIEIGIKYLTVYAFSTENWKRSKEEIDGLMKLFRQYLKKCKKMADKNHMRVTVLGDPRAFDEDIQESIREIEEYSAKYDEHFFQIALNYGSRDEMIRAMKKMLADGHTNPDEMSEALFEHYLDTAGMPDPDLVIRTSGEQRVSNFLLWQMAYSEFYFTPVLWPDYNKETMIEAIRAYSKRDRRFGGV